MAAQSKNLQGNLRSERRPAGGSVRSTRSLVAAASVLALGLSASNASATNALEYPGTGAQAIGRGGAWVARASNPWAVYANPAGLARQGTGVALNVNIPFTETCFDREGPGDPPSGLNTAYPEVCSEGGPTPVPSLGGTFRIADGLTVGLAAVAPNVYGKLAFPETVSMTNTLANGSQVELDVASPQRYMLLELDGIIVGNTLGVGYEAAENLRFGASFIWGIASLELISATKSLNNSNEAEDGDLYTSDVLAELQVRDFFIPGFVIGAQYAPAEEVELGFALRWQDAVKAKGDLTVTPLYWRGSGTNPNATAIDTTETAGDDASSFELPHPMTVMLGGRYRKPRTPGKPGRGEVYDPLVDDVFDVELNVVYTQNSAYDKAKLRFPDDPRISLEAQVPGGQVPSNGDQEYFLEGDTIGVRVGGDYVILPGQLAVRAGAWYEPNVQREEYATVTMVATRRIGLSLGGQYRIGPVDIEASFMHVNFDDIDNGGNGSVRALSGSQNDGFRSTYAINGGKVSQSANIIALGAGATF